MLSMLIAQDDGNSCTHRSSGSSISAFQQNVRYRQGYGVTLQSFEGVKKQSRSSILNVIFSRGRDDGRGYVAKLSKYMNGWKKTERRIPGEAATLLPQKMVTTASLTKIDKDIYLVS